MTGWVLCGTRPGLARAVDPAVIPGDPPGTGPGIDEMAGPPARSPPFFGDRLPQSYDGSGDHHPARRGEPGRHGQGRAPGRRWREPLRLKRADSETLTNFAEWCATT